MENLLPRFSAFITFLCLKAMVLITMTRGRQTILDPQPRLNAVNISIINIKI